ncbi:MAG: CopD family protein, partial [Pseudomonadota bacterium]
MAAFYPWLKAFHLVFVVSWFAGLLYLPRLFVYHTVTEDQVGHERFLVMERKLLGIMTIAAIGAALFGGLMIFANNALLQQPWLHAKLVLVVALITYHVWCGKIIGAFRERRINRSHIWFRWFNEAPAIAL